MEANSFDILLTLVKACKRKGEKYVEAPAPAEYSWAKLDGPSSLLNTVLRHVYCNKGRRCVSEKAQELWIQLGLEPDAIFYHYYHDRVVYQNEQPVKVSVFTGSKGTKDEDRIVYKGDEYGYFKFNDVFHEEHIVPVNMIAKRLLKVDLNKPIDEIYKEFNEIIDRLAICRMLKTEDKVLNKGKKTKREPEIQEVIDGSYNNAGIKIAAWKDWSYEESLEYSK